MKIWYKLYKLVNKLLYKLIKEWNNLLLLIKILINQDNNILLLQRNVLFYTL